MRHGEGELHLDCAIGIHLSEQRADDALLSFISPLIMVEDGEDDERMHAEGRGDRQRQGT